MPYPHHVIGLSESKASAQRLLKRNFGRDVVHMYDDNLALRSGQPSRCFGCHSAKCRPSQMAVDIASGGFPCPPFSQARDKSKPSASRKTGATEDHPQFCMVMDEFVDYLKFRRPLCYWLEEVTGFDVPLEIFNGLSPCKVVAGRLAELGYSSCCLILNHSVFVKMGRERIFLFGCLPEAGGLAGAENIRDTIVNLMQEVEKLQGIRGGAISVWRVVDVSGLQEQRRRRDPEAL